VSVLSGDSGWILEVRDNGVGISPGMLAELFRCDSHVSRPGTRGECGTGFGFNIAQSVTGLFGGKLEVSSEEKATPFRDRGTTVRAWFPRGVSRLPVRGAVPRAAASQELLAPPISSS
jgi:signal transduction histidine kinase